MKKKLVNPTSIAALLLVLGMLVSACAKNNEAKSSEPDMPEYFRKLMGVELSAGMNVSLGGEGCDLESAQASMLSEIDTQMNTSDRAQDILSKCKSIYRCSNGATGFIESKYGTSIDLKIGFVNFKSLGPAPDSYIADQGQKRGEYFTGTGAIYLSESMTNTYEACSYLLHEMVHKVDSEAQQTNHDVFRVEFQAYYKQSEFQQDLQLKGLRFNKTVTLYPVRQKLAEQVAGLTGTSVNSEYVKSFPELPTESATLRSGY